MKGISAVIATIIMLLITIALAGVAYTYIQSTFNGQTSIVLEFDAVATSCDSSDMITVYVRNAGTVPVSLANVLLSGTKPDGTTIFDPNGNANFLCAPVGTLPAGGGSLPCAPFKGGIGVNRVIMSGYNTQMGTITCT